MKYLKTFEDLHLEPQLDDYVLVNIDVSNSTLNKKSEIMEFVNNTVGQISGIKSASLDFFNNIIKGDVMVVYDNVPKDIIPGLLLEDMMVDKKPKYNGLYCRTFDVDKIVAFGKDKEKLEQLTMNKKFNI